MRFSRRLPAALEPNRVSQALSALRRSGAAIIDLTESNPTRAGFHYPADLLAPLADARGLAYRPDPLGLIDARAAVAGDFRRRNVVVESGPDCADGEHQRGLFAAI